MKMSDVFKDYELEYWGAFSAAIEDDRTYGTKTIAAMHATAKHDALVELNKELVEALQECMSLMHGKAYEKAAFKHEASKMICKAKELL